MGKRRVTRFTDANGALKSDWRDPYERQFIEKAYSLGLPEHWMAEEGAKFPLDSQAWEDLGDLTGCFSDGVYILSCCLRGVNESGDPYRRNLSRVVRVLDRLSFLVSKAGVDSRTPGLLPFDVIDYRVQMYQAHDWPMPDKFRERQVSEPVYREGQW